MSCPQPTCQCSVMPCRLQRIQMSRRLVWGCVQAAHTFNLALSRALMALNTSPLGTSACPSAAVLSSPAAAPVALAGSIAAGPGRVNADVSATSLYTNASDVLHQDAPRSSALLQIVALCHINVPATPNDRKIPNQHMMRKRLQNFYAYLPLLLL